MADHDSTTLRRTKPRFTETDSDNHAHIVMRKDQVRGYLNGEPIKALCGKEWVPSRDYEGLPVCQRCVEERERILSGMKNLN